MYTTTFSFFLFVYVLGLAALVGGQIVQLRQKTKYVDRSTLYGAFLILVANGALVATQEFVVGVVMVLMHALLLLAIAVLAVWFVSKKIPRPYDVILFVLSLAEVLFVLIWFV